MQLNDITPMILTYNEAPNIARVLAKLGWARRILVVDSLSTDGTLDILAADSRITVLTRPFDSFAAQCNFGLKHIETEWVLSMDADYVCSDALIRELHGLPGSPQYAAFRVAFSYCVDGRPLRGSLYPPRIVLYRRDLARYTDDGHAHRVVVEGAVGELPSIIYHDDRKPLSTWLRAQQRYASAEMQKLTASPRSNLSLTDRLRAKVWLVPLLTPFYCLFAKGLLLDGRAGLTYTMQRTYAEVLLALWLLEHASTETLARNEQKGSELVRP